MVDNLEEFTNGLQQNGGGHILYFSDNEEQYVANVVKYIVSGIKDGDCILLVENERIYLNIARILSTILTPEEQNRLQTINNFDFYFSKGNFHPMTIVDFFVHTLEPYNEKELMIRCWGHVEWGQQQEIERSIESFEVEINRLIPEMELVAVCAYNAERVSNQLKSRLINCHEYLMTDTTINRIPEKADIGGR